MLLAHTPFVQHIAKYLKSMIFLTVNVNSHKTPKLKK